MIHPYPSMMLSLGRRSFFISRSTKAFLTTSASRFPLSPLHSLPTAARPNIFVYYYRCFQNTPHTFQAINRRRRRAPAGILDRSATPTKDTTSPENLNETILPNRPSKNQQPESTKETTVTAEQFRIQASHLISRIYAALTPLEPLNRGMILSKGRNELDDNDDFPVIHDDDEDTAEQPSVRGDYLYIDLGPVHGQYTIQADEVSQTIIFLSPISGQQVYRYDVTATTAKPEDPSRWICTEDGHILEGLLVRDLIRQIQGVPNL